MRITPPGGIELGHVDAGYLDIIPLAPRSRPFTLTDADRFAISTTPWQPIQSAMLPATLRPHYFAIHTTDPKVSVTLRFLWRKNRQPLDALYAIEKAELGILPPALTAAAFAASRIKNLARRPAIVPAYLARLAQEMGPTSASAPLNQKQVEQLATSCIQGLQLSLPVVPKVPGAVNRARVLLETAKLLWQPTIALQFLDKSEASITQALTFSVPFPLPDPNPIILTTINRAQYTMPDQDSPRFPTWIEWAYLNRYPMTVNGFNQFARLTTAPRIYLEAPPPPPNAEQIKQAILQDANLNQKYTPSGEFFLDIPKGFPLQATGFLISADEKGLWFTVLTPTHHLPVCRWESGRILNAYTQSVGSPPITITTHPALTLTTTQDLTSPAPRATLNTANQILNIPPLVYAHRRYDGPT